jgi:hypothetical protein
MPIYTRFQKVGDIKDLTFSNVVREGLIEFFNWAMLEIHGYVDVPVVGLNSANPNLPCNFFPVHQPGVDDGTVWQSPRSNWVWESGLESGDVPTPYAGVYVDGAFHAAGSTGAFAHYADYVNGRIVFATPVAATSIVQAAYSHRWLSIYDQDIPWFKSVVLEQFEGDQRAAGGATSLLRDNRVQLPAVVIEHGRRVRQVPRQLGDLSQWVSVDYLFHVLAETDVDLTTVVDIVTSQKDSIIYLYDANARAAANATPFDWRGAPNPGAMTFPELVQEPPAGFRWRECQFVGLNPQVSDTTLPVFKSVIRVTVEVPN